MNRPKTLLYSSLLIIAGFCLLFSSLPTMFLLRSRTSLSWDDCQLMGVIPFCAGFSAMGIALYMSCRLQMRGDDAFYKEDKSGIGLLLEYMHSYYKQWIFAETSKKPPYSDLVHKYTNLLLRMLPQLQPEDRVYLTATQYGILFKLLQMNDGYLVQATLEALSNIGDSRALPHVRKLAAGNGKARESAEIREAARDCLTAIEARLQQQNASDILLRATQAPTPTPDTLLRPVATQPVNAADAYQLLRADAGSRDESAAK